MKYSLFIGRFQPLHKGHVKLIRTVLNEGKNVLVFLKDTGKNENNPYNVSQRINMFADKFDKEMQTGQLKIHSIPQIDIDEVVYGRRVGWGIRQIRLDKKTENISGTKIRKNDKI